MEDDGNRTPTRSEIDTFKVLANPEFASIRKEEPNAQSFKVAGLSSDVEEWGGEEEEEQYEDLRSPSPPLSAPRSREASRENSVAASVHTIIRPTEAFEINNRVSAAASEPSTSPEEMARLKAQASAEIDIEKEALLYEIDLLEKQGLIKLQRKLTMEDTLDSIQYQYDRANMIISTQQTVEWSKNGIKMGSTMLETLARKFGYTIIDGFSQNLCKDMNKFNQPLTKLVRKYWRKGSSSPEMELGMLVFSSLALTVVANKTSGPKTVASQETVKEETSVLRPPSFGAKPSIQSPLAASGMAASSSSSNAAGGASKTQIPEWARNALNNPLPTTEHFSKVVDTYPEVARGPPEPIYPVLQTAAAPQQQHPQTPVIESKQSESIKRLILSSPKTNRRKKETAVELNLDDT